MGRPCLTRWALTLVGALAATLTVAMAASREPEPREESPAGVLEGRGREMMKRFLEAKVRAAAARPRPESREAFEPRRRQDRHELMRCLGLDPMPPRTPLEARVTGVLRRPGYHIEKLVFESRPGFPVTAHLYLPDHPEGARLPVIVNPHGHWRLKKQEPRVQTRAIAQALHGYLALVVDSPGSSFEGDARIERRQAGFHNDLRLILGSTNATTIYVWDLMRALDYLETRPEADMTRVGITGASGGGLATLYAFAADERFKVAVPVCYATSLVDNPYNGCLCNHVPGVLQIGDRADILAIRAPAPIFVIGARKDREFPPEGTKRTGRTLEAIYELFGARQKVRWRIFDSGHDYNQAMREAALGFFDQHLRGRGEGAPVPEPSIETLPPDSTELLCLPDPPGGLTTMRDVARARLAGARPHPFADVVALNGGLAPDAPLDFRELPKSDDSPGSPIPVSFTSQPGLTIPGLLWRPEGPPRAALVLVAEHGKRTAMKTYPIERLVAAGYACLAIDVRGWGELEGLDPRLMAYLGTADAFAMGRDAARAAVGMRRFASKVGVIGRGPCGAQIAMFAALMEPAVDLVLGLQGMRSYRDAWSSDIPTYAIQPRADLGAPLAHLRSLVEPSALWTFRGEAEVDLVETLEKMIGK